PMPLDTNETVLEVIVMWGAESVLHVAHLPAPHAFCVGESDADGGDAPPDFLIGEESLGRRRLPITVDSGGVPMLVVPEGARGQLCEDAECVAIEDLLAAGALPACAAVTGACEYPLRRGTSARIEYRGFTFIVRPTSAAPRIGVGGGPVTDAW